MFWIRNTPKKYPKVIKPLDINPFTQCQFEDLEDDMDSKTQSLSSTTSDPGNKDQATIEELAKHYYYDQLKEEHHRVYSLRAADFTTGCSTDISIVVVTTVN
jgi:hypothetical protein